MGSDAEGLGLVCSLDLNVFLLTLKDKAPLGSSKLSFSSIISWVPCFLPTNLTHPVVSSPSGSLNEYALLGH